MTFLKLYGKVWYFMEAFKMTKKITITLEENLIDELGLLAQETGKKKTQVVREALQDYMDVNAVTKTVHDYKTSLIDTLSHKDVKAALGL